MFYVSKKSFWHQLLLQYDAIKIHFSIVAAWKGLANKHEMCLCRCGICFISHSFPISQCCLPDLQGAIFLEAVVTGRLLSLKRYIPNI